MTFNEIINFPALKNIEDWNFPVKILRDDGEIREIKDTRLTLNNGKSCLIIMENA